MILGPIYYILATRNGFESSYYGLIVIYGAVVEDHSCLFRKKPQVGQLSELTGEDELCLLRPILFA